MEKQQQANFARTVYSVTVTGEFSQSPRNSEKSFSAKNITPGDVYSLDRKSFNSIDKKFLATVKEVISDLEKSNAHIEEMQYTPPILSLTVSFTSKSDAECFRKLIYGRS